MYNSHKKNHIGAVLVEFALVVPLFFLLIFALLEFGWIIQARQHISHAAREGARFLAIRGSSVSQAEKITIKNIKMSGLPTINVIATGFDSNPTCKRKKSEISMEIQVPMSDISLTGDPFNFFTKEKYITVKIVMRKECII